MPYDCGPERDDDGDDDRWLQLVVRLLDDPQFRAVLTETLASIVQSQLHDGDGPIEVRAIGHAMFRSPAFRACLTAAAQEYLRGAP
jgi:hypothetical protein